MKDRNLLADVFHLGETLVLVFEEVVESLDDGFVIFDFPVFEVGKVLVVGLAADVDVAGLLFNLYFYGLHVESNQEILLRLDC